MRAERFGPRLQGLDAHTRLACRELLLLGIGPCDSLGGGRRRFEIPSGPGLSAGALPILFPLRRLTRTTPIFLPGLVAEDVRIRIDLPADLHPLILPPPVKLAARGASIETLVERDERRIILRRHFEISERTIVPEEFAGFRAADLEQMSAKRTQSTSGGGSRSRSGWPDGIRGGALAVLAALAASPLDRRPS